MTYAEIRQLRLFVSSLTAKCKVPWCIAEVPHSVGPEIVVRIDPIRSALKGELKADEVIRIPAHVGLDEAKAMVIEKLAAQAR